MRRMVNACVSCGEHLSDEPGEGCEHEDDHEDYSDHCDDLDDRESERDTMFADPGGRSALRAATPDDPRDQPCPTCESPDRLTRQDKALGYQCDGCADRLEQGGY